MCTVIPDPAFCQPRHMPTAPPSGPRHPVLPCAIPNPGVNMLQAMQRYREKIGQWPAVQYIMHAWRRRLYGTRFPPGHYYAAIPSIAEIERDAARIFAASAPEIPAIDLCPRQQLELLAAFTPFYAQMPRHAHKTPGFRYYHDNLFFGPCDALTLFCLIRHLQPRQIIEVGSGFSSALMLDTIEHFLPGRVACTFIDPYPDRLLSLLTPQDAAHTTLRRQKVQDVPLDLFRSLSANDILFIDSSHTVKTGSDVNYLIFQVLPVLASGVVIHFHDVWFPFEYPHQWIREGIFWNEAYLLRAFLQYNAQFQILLFNDYLVRFHNPLLAQLFPLAPPWTGGSLWIRKL